MPPSLPRSSVAEAASGHTSITVPDRRQRRDLLDITPGLGDTKMSVLLTALSEVHRFEKRALCCRLRRSLAQRALVRKMEESYPATQDRRCLAPQASLPAGHRRPAA
ncbi:protein of unknown function [Methylocaldum szegediense]|uniref:Uncharacterized protein n=1 Tax=Methylocaldum szegediense TaxID=73780 RepID=A0ABM9HXG7_9GAMM|nr:protein of unknown function [Methylocaldum szegediense]